MKKINLLIICLIALLSLILVGCNKKSEKIDDDWHEIFEKDKFRNVKVVYKYEGTMSDNSYKGKSVYYFQKDGFYCKSQYKSSYENEKSEYYFVVDDDDQYRYRKDDGVWWWEEVSGYDSKGLIKIAFDLDYFLSLGIFTYNEDKACYTNEYGQCDYSVYFKNNRVSKIIIEGENYYEEYTFSRYGKIKSELPSK